MTSSTTPQPILQPGGLLCHANFTYKSLPHPSPPPSHILLTFFATQTASPNASFGDITDSHGLLLVSHLFLQALPQWGRDLQGVFSRGWGGGGVGSGLWSCFLSGPAAVSVGCGSGDCPCSPVAGSALCFWILIGLSLCECTQRLLQSIPISILIPKKMPINNSCLKAAFHVFDN